MRSPAAGPAAVPLLLRCPAGRDTSAVTTLLGTFYGASVFDRPISNWDTAAVGAELPTCVEQQPDSTDPHVQVRNIGFTFSSAKKFFRKSVANCKIENFVTSNSAFTE